MSNYNHTRFGRRIETSGARRFLQGLTIRSMLVILLGMTLAGLIITSDMDVLLKLPLAAIPLSIMLVFLLVRPNDRPFEEFVVNWANFRRKPNTSVFKGHHGYDPSGVQVDPWLNQHGTAAAVRSPAARAQPHFELQAVTWQAVSLAGVLVGFWLVTGASLFLITTIRSRLMF